MNWKLARSRRGLATVVTSAIMMAAVCTLGSAGVVWSQSSLNSQQLEMSDTVDNYLNKINESMMFEYVYCNSDPCETIIVVITNVGDLGLDISEIKFYDKVSGFTKVQSLSKGQILPDASISVVIDDTSFQFYYARGNIIQTQIHT